MLKNIDRDINHDRNKSEKYYLNIRKKLSDFYAKKIFLSSQCVIEYITNFLTNIPSVTL